ncbi:uncharacterized protein AKAME5_002310100 [Lates japonicus]|uniref:Uncharacterized protein n=1 Tax=Lates japonicus TaxID=270547 RepID=A0AAD3RKD4_LATJO|nr:uncharacterized protein AKAME5_002310100 [Lates japonicus]
MGVTAEHSSVSEPIPTRSFLCNDSVLYGDRLRQSTNSHVIAGLDEKRVFHIWDFVLGFSQKKIHKEEEDRSEGAG